MALPTTWADVYARIGRVLGADDMEVQEWFRQAVEAAYGITTLRELPHHRRAVIFQKISGVVLALEDEGDLAFCTEQRQIVAAIFARYFGGYALAGPPWRVSPFEQLPGQAEYLAGLSDF